MEPIVGKRVIYDLGANNGDDIPYYLQKADLVVAVEANPALADLMRSRFPEEIAQDRLRIENCVLVTGKGGDRVPFYIHKTSHLASQFPTPSSQTPITAGYASDLSQYDRVELPSIGATELIVKHGTPYYMKLDLESYDAQVLRELFENGIVPPLISAESHSIDILSLMVVLGGYNAFKLVTGSQVGRDFAHHTILGRDGPVAYSFPDHSAGPFGEDIPGEWQNANSFFRFLALHGLGWCDVHASRIHEPVSTARQSLFDYLIEERVPRTLRGVARAVVHPAARLFGKPWPESETGRLA